MQRKIVITADGSSSLFDHEIDEYFHSHYGAIQESKHIFIQAGFLHDDIQNRENISILEIGFGTGLNCYLTYLQNFEMDKSIYYEGIELHPLCSDEYTKLNYPEQLNRETTQDIFLKLHQSSWNQEIEVDKKFTLFKRDQSFEIVALTPNQFDLVYFDSFSPDKQPEMWNHFSKIFDSMKPGAILVTYCTKGIVKRALRSVGFFIEKLAGPIGKREILRAFKPKS